MADSIEKQLPATEVFPQAEREEEYNLPPLKTVRTIFEPVFLDKNEKFDSEIVFH